MPHRRISICRLVVLGCGVGVLLAGVLPALAQHPKADAALPEPRYSFDLRGASLDEALHQLISTAPIDVAYANALVAGKKTTCTVVEANVETVLRCILEGQGLVFQRLRSGAYVIKKATPTVPPDSSDVQARVSPKERSMPGSISGRVLEEKTGLPLAGANVVVVGTQFGAASGPEGRFAIARVPPGNYTLEVSMIGYETRRLEPLIVQEQGAPLAVTVELKEAFTPLREVIVTPGHFTLLHRQPTTRQTLSREDLQRLPTLGDDVYRAVRRLPGISGHDFSAGFTVRGGEHKEVLVLLDGMELYEPFHLKDVSGGFFSIIDLEAIEGVDMMTGAFPVDYGDRLSGVFKIQSATAPRDHRRTSLGFSLSNVRFLSEGRFSKGKGQWLAVARRGYIDLMLRLIGENEQFDPSYYDLYTKVHYQLNANHALSVHVLSAGDRVKFLDDTSFTLHSNYGNTYNWLTWKATLNPHLFAQTIFSVGRITRNRAAVDFFDGSEGDVVFEVADQRSFQFLGLKQDWTYEQGARYLLKAGFDIKQLEASYRYEKHVRENEDPLVDFDTTSVRLRPSGPEVGAYLGTRIQVAPALTAEVGLRYDYASWANDKNVSPRLNLAYAIAARTVVRLGWGRFYQSQGIHELDVQDGDDMFHPAELAEHRVIGLDHRFRNHIQLRLEAYHKKRSDLRPTYLNLLNDVLYSFPEAELGRVRVTPERGEAKGIEFFLKKNTGGKFNGWINYSLAFAQDEIDGTTIPRYFDQRHTVYLDFGYRPSRKWSLNVAWLFRSGWPYTASTFEQSASSDEVFLINVPAGPMNAERLPAYHRLDLRASRHFTFSRSRLSIFLDIQNLYNRRNVRLFVPSVVSLEPNGDVTVHNTADYFLPLLPSLGLRWELFH